MKFTSSRQPSQAQCNSTIIYFYQREQNVTQFVKVLLVKLSDMLHTSNFVRLFHRQSFMLYGISRGTVIMIVMVKMVHNPHIAASIMATILVVMMFL